MVESRLVQKTKVIQEAIRQVMKWEPGYFDVLHTLAVAELETHCGDDWPGSNNYGAVQKRKVTMSERKEVEEGTLTPGTIRGDGILHVDSSPETGKYMVWFCAFPTELEGAKHFVRTLILNRPNVRAHLTSFERNFDTIGFAKEMYLSGYYEGKHKGRPYYLRKEPYTQEEINNWVEYGMKLDKVCEGIEKAWQEHQDQTKKEVSSE